MKRVIFALAASAAILLPRLAFSEQVSNLYEIQVPVMSQGVEARRAGFSAALAGVLVKLSGVSDIAGRATLTDALNKPERYVDQFRYLEPQNGSRSTQSLWVHFDGRALEELLRGKGLPVWGATRPAALVWLAVEDKGKRVLTASSENSPASAALRSAAARRGLPLKLPMLDLQERKRIQPSDVWGSFGDIIQSASARYRPQAVLTGALYREDADEWHVRWTLYRNGSVIQRWETGGTLEEVVNSGIDVTTDELARAFSSASGSGAGGPLLMRVSGVRTMQDYLRVTNYIRSLAGVTAVQAVEVSGDQLVLSVALRGAVEGFTQAVSLGDTLAPVQDPTQTGTELTYRLAQ